jgi:uncharacterized membrane protein YkvA (DUF1232 family)
MVRRVGGLLTAAALLLGILMPTGSPQAGALVSSDLVAVIPAALVDGGGQPLEQWVSGFAKSIVREIRWSFRMLRWMFWRAIDWWATGFRRAGLLVAVALVAALADSGLVSAWRAEGLRALVTYSTLMLYVYARLLFSGGVSLAPKLLLLGALIYGVIRRDLVPDRTLVPGRIEDIVLIVIATRAFVYACPEELVNEYAQRAVKLKRRVMTQRARYR